MHLTLRSASIAALFFALGVAAAHLLPSAVAAAGAPLTAAAIDLGAIGPDALPSPTATFPNLRSKTLVSAAGMTLAVQIGSAAKHYHADADELQVILEGTGTEWLGDRQIALKPGMLIVIPNGTPHAGQVATAGSLKVLSIKTPPQDPADVHFVP